MINSHPYMKTRIVMKDGEVFQETRDSLIIDDLIEIVELDNVDEDYGYQHMVDCGFTPDIVAEYYNPGIADVMQKYCEEHGIEAR